MSSEISSMSILDIWIKALASPNEETYQQIADDPGASFGKSVLWIFLAGLASAFIYGVIYYIRLNFLSPGLGGFGDYGEFFPGGLLSPPSIVSMITCAPFVAIASVVSALVSTGLIFVASRALGGIGSYEKLFCTLTAFQVPLSVATTLVGSIPWVGCLGFLLGIYGLVLGVIANKVVMQYDWGKAVIASVVVPVVIGTIIFFCVFVVVGAAIGSVFGNIMDSLNSIP
jgi:hypothetical protein